MAGSKPLMKWTIEEVLRDDKTRWLECVMTTGSHVFRCAVQLMGGDDYGVLAAGQVNAARRHMEKKGWLKS
jgi:hypothetical protein